MPHILIARAKKSPLVFGGYSALDNDKLCKSTNIFGLSNNQSIFFSKNIKRTTYNILISLLFDCSPLLLQFCLFPF
jgi:hypothetical protein